MRYVCLFVFLGSTLWAQDGATIYKQRCATCHDTPAARVPSVSTIQGMSADAIYLALTRGVMKTQADGLSSAELFSLIGILRPLPLPMRPMLL